MKRQPAHPCPTCHGFARARMADGRIACTRCGTILEPLPFPGRGGMPHRAFIRPGMKARIGGKEFVAVGRIGYTQREEGKTYAWEEWVLLDPDGDARYLEYDEGKWTLSGPFTPREAPSAVKLSGATEGNGFRIDGALATVKDAGDCQVSGVEGEIPWPVAAGQSLHFVDLEAGSAFYSAELDGGEIEWFRGQRLDDRAVFTLFDQRELLAALDRREAALRSRRRFGLWCLLAALAALLGWGMAGANGKTVASGSASLAEIGPTGKRFGPYFLNAPGRVYRLRVSSNLSQAAAWVQAVIEDDVGELLDTSGELWDESGSDEDGPWHEYSLQAQSDFRLDRPGSVYVRLFVEPEAAAGSGSATVTFAVEQGVLHPTYLAGFGGSVLALGAIFLIAGAPGLARGVWRGMGSV